MAEAENIFLEDSTYITEAELKASTRITDVELSWEDSVDNRKILIRKAEIAIDSILWSYGTKADPLQDTIFPTVENWVPKAIKKATVLLCEAMFLGGELEASGSYSGAKIVKSEAHGDHKVEFQDEDVSVSAMRKKNQYVSQEIETLLKPFVTTTSGVRWSKNV